MDNGEIGGFVKIGQIAYPLTKIPQNKLEWYREKYAGLVGIPKDIVVCADADKFYLFPYPTNDWPLRYFSSNNQQIHTSCFNSKK